MLHYSFSLDYLPDSHLHHTDGIFCFFEGNQLVEVGSEPGVLSSFADLAMLESNHLQTPIYIGSYDRKLYFALELQKGTAKDRGLNYVSMRTLGAENEILFALLARGLQLINWKRNHRFCGRCGSSTIPSGTEYAMTCVECSLSYYPKIMPCIMALVVSGDQCLLARHANRGTGKFSTLAGFIEAGESVEHAVYREVLEEVGIKTGKITYYSSQAWPFPGQLMLGFYAEYLEGDIVPEEGEIEEAQWFSVSDLESLELPEPFSLSGRLIRSFRGFDNR